MTRRLVRLAGLTPGLLAVAVYLWAAWLAAGGDMLPMMLVGIAFIIASLRG